MLRRPQPLCRSLVVLTDGLFLFAVADETIQAIDRFFDTLDNGVAAVDRVLNRSSQTTDRAAATVDQHKARRSKREVIEAEATPKTAPTSKVSAEKTAVVRKPHFYIVEAPDPKSGHTIFVVTDGGAARTECATREFATQILLALEKAP